MSDWFTGFVMGGSACATVTWLVTYYTMYERTIRIDDPLYVSPVAINVVAGIMFDDFHARRAGTSWEERTEDEVIVIQLKATARAALLAAQRANKEAA